MSKSSRTNELVYEFVCKNPGMCTYDIEKKLNMSGGRIRHSLFRLEQMKLVGFKWVRNSPRLLKLTFPVPAVKILPKKLLKEVKRVKV